MQIPYTVSPCLDFIDSKRTNCTKRATSKNVWHFYIYTSFNKRSCRECEIASLNAWMRFKNASTHTITIPCKHSDIIDHTIFDRIDYSTGSTIVNCSFWWIFTTTKVHLGRGVKERRSMKYYTCFQNKSELDPRSWRTLNAEREFPAKRWFVCHRSLGRVVNQVGNTGRRPGRTKIVIVTFLI